MSGAPFSGCAHRVIHERVVLLRHDGLFPRAYAGVAAVTASLPTGTVTEYGYLTMDAGIVILIRIAPWVVR